MAYQISRGLLDRMRQGFEQRHPFAILKAQAEAAHDRWMHERIEALMDEQHFLGSLIGQAKPRIRLRFGIWGCVSRRPGGRGLVAGYGYTPMQAYEDWRSRAPITDLTE